MDQWKIQRDRSQAEVCSRGGCALAGQPEYYAILELPECIRRQVCLTCFHELRTEAGEDGEMPFHWKVRRKADGRQQPLLDLTSLRSLFDRLGEESLDAAGDAGEDDEAGGRPAAGLRYLVALLLLRKRVLKMVDPTSPEEEAADMLVVDPKIEGMEPVALSAPRLEPDDMAT